MIKLSSAIDCTQPTDESCNGNLFSVGAENWEI